MALRTPRRQRRGAGFLDEITPHKVRELWEKGMNATRAERETAAVNAMFLRNRQWVYWDRSSGRLEEVPRHPERLRATVNKMGPDSRRIISKLLRRPLMFDVPPDSADDAASQASRIAEAVLVETHREQDWENFRHDHANVVWQGGWGAVCVEWDSEAGAVLPQQQQEPSPLEAGDGSQVTHVGDVKLSVISLHEIAVEPGTHDVEKALYWVRGQAFPPSEVQAMYDLESEPQGDARAVDSIHRYREDDRSNKQYVPLTMVYTYHGRPYRGRPGQVMTVVGDNVVEQSGWPFPFEDRLNLSAAIVEPIHNTWYGHTPVTDAVPVQALLNAAWSSVGEHMKLAGNARLWVPEGAVDDLESITDEPGEAVGYNPINGRKPEYESPPTMPDWWSRHPSNVGDALDDILSVHDVSRGDAPGGVESGIALSILSENDDTPVGALAKSLAECWGRVATMVLELYGSRVMDSRSTRVVLPTNVPENRQWVGKDLAGATTAVVPLDAVMPRSRAGQAAYAMQLFDRGIITTPGELAKVADLPDQDDLLEGIDPDTARAQRENYQLSVGIPRTVDVIDDNANHIHHHRNFIRSARYEQLDPQLQTLCRMHLAAHEIYAAELAARQLKAAQVSPAAAALPTEAPPVLPTGSLGEAAALAATAPGVPSEIAAMLPPDSMAAPTEPTPTSEVPHAPE